MPNERYQLIQLPNGAQAVYSSAYDEKMHPGLGPAAEADLLYVRQLKVPERMQDGSGEFVVWDVGLGAAANAIAVLRATKDIARPLRLISFDNTAEPLAFALVGLTAILLGSMAYPAIPAYFERGSMTLAVSLWQSRVLDVWIQIVLIFSGVMGVLGLLSEKAPGRAQEIHQ